QFENFNSTNGNDVIRSINAGTGRAALFQITNPLNSSSALEIVSSGTGRAIRAQSRSEEHTSELQSQSNLVCRLLLEKKKPNSCVSWWNGTSCTPAAPGHASCSRTGIVPCRASSK